VPSSLHRQVLGRVSCAEDLLEFLVNFVGYANLLVPATLLPVKPILFTLVVGGLRLAAGFLVAGFLGFICDTPQHQKVHET
jgi:hypothetical protein